MSTSTELSYTISGMSCSCCEGAIRKEVEQLAGVASLDVDAGTGSLVVRGTDVDDAAVRAAVREAGYETVG